MKKYSFYAVSCILIYLSIELVAAGGLFLLKKVQHLEYHPILTASLPSLEQRTLQDLIDGKTTYLFHNAILGWTIKPGGYWYDLYRANAQGIRGDREYQNVPQKNIIRIVTFGDSFTHGEEVKNADTWQEQMNQVRQNLEVINFGVGGYGLDQSFLRYRNEGRLYNPHIVFIGFMEENINRLVNIFRPFYLPGIPLTKPRFITQGKQLVLMPNPMADFNDCKNLLHNPKIFLSKFGAHDFHYNVGLKDGPLDFSPAVRMLKLLYNRIYSSYLEYTDKSIYKSGYFNPKSEAFRICVTLFDTFYHEVQKNNSLPVIVLFPNRTDIERYRKYKTKVYSPLIEYFHSKGYRFIDVIDAFEKYAKSSRTDELFLKQHYSSLGNSVVARFLLDYLSENSFTSAPAFTTAISSPGMPKPAEVKKP